MKTNRRLPRPFLAQLFLVAAILGIGADGARAQSSGLNEAVGPDGVVLSPELTPAQKNAIDDAVNQQRVRSSSEGIATTVGAIVPPSAPLRDLPDQVALGIGAGRPLKYAMVEGEIVVVDPISMRVVDVISRGAGP